MLLSLSVAARQLVLTEPERDAANMHAPLSVDVGGVVCRLECNFSSRSLASKPLGTQYASDRSPKKITTKRSVVFAAISATSLSLNNAGEKSDWKCEKTYRTIVFIT